jgi:hypothetical protein
MIANHILHDDLDLLRGQLLELVCHQNVELGSDFVNRDEGVGIEFLDKGFGHFFAKTNEKRFQHWGHHRNTTELEQLGERERGKQREAERERQSRKRDRQRERQGERETEQKERQRERDRERESERQRGKERVKPFVRL